MYNKRISKQSVAIAYAQRANRRRIAALLILNKGWFRDYLYSPYRSPVTYLRHRHGITWKDYYPAWGGIMYTKYGK